jgi:hypothetical protein
MIKMIKRMVLTLIVAVFGLGAMSATAQADEHDARFWNYNSAVPILMCKDWTTQYGDGYGDRGTCKHIADGGAKRYLYRGYETLQTFGWRDTDGLYVKAYHNVALRRTENSANAWVVWGRYTGWHKKGGCSGCVYEVKQYHT